MPVNIFHKAKNNKQRIDRLTRFIEAMNRTDHDRRRKRKKNKVSLRYDKIS